MATANVEITRRDQGDKGEYHALVSGSDAVGRLTWVKRADGARVAEHTLVPREIGGRGIAGELVKELVADARENDFKIVPQCSYVAAKFDKNPEWADLLA
jgi:predicted GNAT family acetyltransferase